MVGVTTARICIKDLSIKKVETTAMEYDLDYTNGGGKTYPLQVAPFPQLRTV